LSRKSEYIALESIIGYSLLVCVITALSLEVLGLILYVSNGNNVNINLNQELCIREENFFSYIARTVRSALRRPSYTNLMSLGLAVLMLTPYLRGVLSVAYFALTENYKYTLLTSFVMLVITISLVIR